MTRNNHVGPVAQPPSDLVGGLTRVGSLPFHGRCVIDVWCWARLVFMRSAISVRLMAWRSMAGDGDGQQLVGIVKLKASRNRLLQANKAQHDVGVGERRQGADPGRQPGTECGRRVARCSTEWSTKAMRFPGQLLNGGR
jgi:hypothetical protein